MEFDEIVVKESPGLCRCCLSEGCYKDLGTEYTWMNETEVYADMLLECFDISITQHNDGPNGPNRLICEVCITRLRDACNFKKQVLDSEKKFIDMIGRGEFQPKVLICQTQLKSENETVDVPDEEPEVEFLDEDIDFGDDSEFRDDTEASVSDITVSALPIKGKRGRPRKNPLLKPDKRLKLKEDKVKKVNKDLETEPTKHSANYLRRRNLQILFNNTTLIPFKWRSKYMCFYCGDDCDSYESLRKHTVGHGLCTDTDRAIRLVKAPDSEIKIDVSDITCEICSERFPYIDDIINHLIFKHHLPYNKDVELMISTYRLIDLKCLVCDDHFDFLQKLIRHVNNFHPNNCFLCPDCKQKFNKKHDLNSHIRSHHKKVYSCLKCEHTFSTSSALQTHKANAHISSCNICFQTFPSDSKRLNHMKRDHDNDQTQCGFCLKVLTTKQAFLRHAAQCTVKHKAEETIIVDDDKNLSVKDMRNSIASIVNTSTAIPFKFFMHSFRCFYCSKDFKTCEEVKQHTQTEHPTCDTRFKGMKFRNRYDGTLIKIDISSLSCKLCFKVMRDLNELVTHLSSEHKVQIDKDILRYVESFQLNKDKYPCPVCGEEYRNFGLLLKHMNSLHTDNKHICMYCGKSFRALTNLKGHISRHHTKKINNKCNTCDLLFPTYNARKTHIATAHGTKVIHCSKCPETFSSKYGLQRHMVVAHGTGHKCSYCNKLFVKSSLVLNHIRRLHLNEKNVECSVCLEKFFDSTRLKLHMVKHVNERKFHCDICGKKFLRKMNLKNHILCHIRKANALNIT